MRRLFTKSIRARISTAFTFGGGDGLQDPQEFIHALGPVAGLDGDRFHDYLSQLRIQLGANLKQMNRLLGVVQHCRFARHILRWPR